MVISMIANRGVVAARTRAPKAAYVPLLAGTSGTDEFVPGSVPGGPPD